MGFEMTLPGMKKPLKPIPVFKQMPGKKKKAKKGIIVKTKEEKRQIRRAKDKERKRKKKGLNNQNNDILDFDSAKFSDSIKFNEVVHAPPENLKVQNFSERNPGQKNNLLLSKKLSQSKSLNNNVKAKSQKNSMSLARKSMLEQERKRVIEEYRKTKIKK